MDLVQLRPAPSPARVGPVVVAVLDGIGIGKRDAGDAVHAARTPCLDAQLATQPWVALRAHGPAVGLASATDVGNSEVGHNALGSGQIVDQGAKRVAQAVASGAAFATDAWQRLVARCGPGGGTLHLVGLLSDGGVHAHVDHLLATLHAAHRANVPRVCVHALLDGRDVGRTSALTYVAQLERVLADVNLAADRDYRVASGGGRSRITMDRYGAAWPMVAEGWQHHVHAQGQAFASLREAVVALRDAHPGIGDQDLPPFVIGPAAPGVAGATGLGPVCDGDGVLLLNFRGDRMLQLVDAFAEEDFCGFDRGRRPRVLLVGMTRYDGDTQRPKHFLVAPPHIAHTLGELLARAGVAQLAVAETQKFGHVTYFWNGNRSQPFAHEHAVEVPSLPAPFDAQPQMRAAEVAEATIVGLQRTKARFCRLNLAGGDMVGHTGNFAATVRAVEAVDAALARLVDGVVGAMGGALVITADHGNAEDMAERDAEGTPLRDQDGALLRKNSHSLNLVPCAFVLPPQLRRHWALAEVFEPGLANVAASCAALLGYAPPPGLWRPSLLRYQGES